MYTTTTVAIRRGGYPPVAYPPVAYPPVAYPPVAYPPVVPPVAYPPVVPPVVGPIGQPTITILVPWTQEFGLAYQQFLSSGVGYAPQNFGLGGLGGYGGGLGGYGGGLGGYGGGLGGIGGAYPVGPSIGGYPVGFGVTTF